MRAGPKAAISAPPLDLSHLPRRKAAQAIAFIEGHLKIPKGKGARQSVRLRPWQKKIVRGVLAPNVRQALVSIARGNGKTALAAMLACYGLFEGEEGAQVLTLASDERQARITWNMARRMIELNPELEKRVQIFQDRIYLPHTDSVLAPLPAEPQALQGWDPSLAIVDELHVVKEDVWDAMSLAAGKRKRSLLLAISTAAGDKDGVMWRLAEHGRAGEDPAFSYFEWTAPEGCAADDEEAWKVANPALGDFLSVDAVRATLRTTRDPVFRRYRLNQWVGQVGSWLPWGIWDELSDPGRHVDGPIVVAFSGTGDGDCAALVGATIEPEPHVFVLGLWEAPDGERVGREMVTTAVDHAFERYQIKELAASPWGWRSEVETWELRYERVVSWPTNLTSRMAPAADRLFQFVQEATVTHDGNKGMARHIGNCIAKPSPLGDVVTKDQHNSSRKINAAVAAIVATDRAMFYERNNKEPLVAWVNR